MDEIKFSLRDLRNVASSVGCVKDGEILRLKKALWREKYEHAAFRLEYYTQKLKEEKDGKPTDL